MLKNSSSSYSHLGDYYGALDLCDRRLAPPIIDYNTGIFNVGEKKPRSFAKRGGSNCKGEMEGKLRVGKKGPRQVQSFTYLLYQNSVLR